MQNEKYSFLPINFIFSKFFRSSFPFRFIGKIVSKNLQKELYYTILKENFSAVLGAVYLTGCYWSISNKLFIANKYVYIVYRFCSLFRFLIRYNMPEIAAKLI